MDINNEQEAEFAQKLMIGKVVILTYNKDYTSIGVDNDNIFIYANGVTEIDKYVKSILLNPSITKLISKPTPAVKVFFRLDSCESCNHISNYVSEKIKREVPEMNHEIMDQYHVENLRTRAVNVATIMMKYKLQADKPIKKRKKSYFNKTRDCYLLYLSAYNEILIRNGPLRFAELTSIIMRYSDLCQVKLSPSMALDGLIAMGALINDRKTTIVSIPDQI